MCAVRYRVAKKISSLFMDYLRWLLFGIWLPAAVLWLFVKRPVGSKLKMAAKLGAIVLVTQLPVEYLTLRYPMVMGEGHYLGIRLFLFPLEDFLFFLTIPFLVFALVHLIDDYVTKKC